MKTKTYRWGTIPCRSYFKPAANGFEVGFIFDKKPCFVGNFVRREEAQKWFTQMNKELAHFGRKYWVGPTVPKVWYCKFITNHLYKTYYTFVDRLCTHHNRKYARAVTQDMRRYRQLKRTSHWTPNRQLPWRTAA